MCNKKTILFFAFLIILSCLKPLAENPLTINQNELLEEFTEACFILDKIDANIAAQLGICCQQCLISILTPAEFSGTLFACWILDQEGKALDQLREFKELLKTPDVQTINQYLLTLAQDYKIECGNCRGYFGWIKRK